MDNVGERIDWCESRINYNGNINLVSFSKARQDYYIEYDYDKNIFTLTNFVNGTKTYFSENEIALYQRENNGCYIQLVTLLSKLRIRSDKLKKLETYITRWHGTSRRLRIRYASRQWWDNEL